MFHVKHLEKYLDRLGACFRFPHIEPIRWDKVE